MTRKKIASSLVLGVTLLALAACSSSVGSGSRPPDDVTVVVPPANVTTNSPN